MGHPRIKLRSADEDLAAHPVVGQRPGRVVQVLPERPVLYFSFFSASFAASLISVDGSPVARFRINGITSRSPSFASPSTLSSLTYGELSLTARRSASLIFCLDRGSLTPEAFFASAAISPVRIFQLLYRLLKDREIGSLAIGGNDEERDHAKEDGDTYRGSH